MQYVLGVDGGGTKTLAAIADIKGNVVGIARTGCSNFQGIGIVRAGMELKDAVDQAIQNAGIDINDLVYATYGIAGADREVDFTTVNAYVEKANVAPEYMLTNDTTIALRAGTKNGAGVALIAGTGANIIGFSNDYTQKKVGGLGRLSGDYGSAGDIAEKGIVAAMKSYDGRGPKTLLEPMLCKAMKVDRIVDMIEFFYIDQYIPVHLGEFAPVVFAAANKGDKVAIGILKNTGLEIGKDAVACIRALFKKSDAFTVILAGSVFQKGENPTLVNALKQFINNRYPNADIIKLKQEPCLGALLWAMDTVRGKPVSVTGKKKTAVSLSTAMKALDKGSES